MVTTKSYTDIEQSRRLAKILEVYTADCYYPVTYIEESTNKYLMSYIKPYIGRLSDIEDSVDTRLYIPCWSLVALLKIIGHYTLQTVSKNKKVFIVSEENYPICSDCYSEPVDACVDMVEKLYGLNLL